MLNFIGKLYAIFTPKDRKHIMSLLIPMTISALLEVVGIAFVAPFMAVVSDPTVIQHSKKLNYLYHLLACSTSHRFLFLLGFIILAFLICGNSFAALTMWLNIKFSNHKGHTISYRLLKNYLSQPYVYFLDKNSATLSKNIFSDTHIFITSILIPGMQALTKSVAILFIIGLLVLVKPLLAIILFIVLCGSYLLIYLFMRKLLAKVSCNLVESQNQRFRIVNEAIGGIKDVKLLNSMMYYLKRFGKVNKCYANNLAAYMTMSQLPRYALEVIAFGGIILTTLFFIATKHNTSEVIPLLAMYVFAGYRLMPALQIVFNSIATIKARVGSIEVLHKDLCDTGISNNIYAVDKLHLDSNFKLNHEIALKKLTFAYPNNSENVLRNLNLKIKANTTVGFVGMTGSGKTTTVDIILGLLAPQMGCVSVDGTTINDANMHTWQGMLGYVPQHIYLADDTIINNIAFGIGEDQIDYEIVEEAAKIANIHNFISSDLAEGYHTIVGERGVRLSGGQRQRIGIARALYRKPQVLILDEATSALDGVTEAYIMDAIHNLAHKKTIIIIAHRVTTLKECDAIYCLEQGKIVASGSYADLLQSNELFKKMAKMKD